MLVLLKGEWSDGTTHLLFEPVELLEKLATLTPRPRINLVLYLWRPGPMPAGAGGPARTAERRRALQQKQTLPSRTASRGAPIVLPKRRPARVASPPTQPNGPRRAVSASLATGPGRDADDGAVMEIRPSR